MPSDDEPDLHDLAQWTAVDGLRIRYVEDAHRSGPDILLLNPWPEGLAGYQACWPRFSAAGRAIAVDLPGFGVSDASEALRSPHAMAGFVLQLIERFRLRHPHLVAPGLWWTCAAEVAVIAPGTVESLIVGQDLFAAQAAPGDRPTLKSLRKDVRAALRGSSLPDRALAQLLRQMAKTDIKIVSPYLQAHRATAKGATGIMSSFLTPVLIVEGDGGAEAGPASDWIAASWPRRRHALLGALSWTQSPEAFGDLSAAWIAGGYRAAGDLTGVGTERPQLRRD